MATHSGRGGQMGTFWGQSYESYDAAVATAVEAAQRALANKDIEWFEVIEFRGAVHDGKLQYQTSVRVGYA